MEAKRRKVEMHMGESVSEQDVGISEFVSFQLPGYKGLIKQRYSDFQVNEIGLDGQKVELKTLPIEEPMQEEEKEEEKEESNIPPKIEESEKTTELGEILGKEFTEKCLALANVRTNDEHRSLRTEPLTNKDTRTKVHGLIREAFDSRLDTRTEDGGIVVHKVSNARRIKSKQRQKVPQSQRGKDYLQFTLYKENKDTMEAVSLLAKLLHIPNKAITFAGTKDRRAVTTQRLCWRRGNIARLQGLQLRGNMCLSDYEFCGHTLKLGDLQGNQFGIVIRDVDSSKLAVVDESLTSLRDFGFINYYGLQRFGTFSVPSHIIGKYILCEDYDKAVDSLLNPQDFTAKESKEARQIWAEERDAAKALNLMPRRCLAESSLLQALSESPNSLNALLHVPHSLKTMYVHAYQSYIWNSMASERIVLSRTKPIEGDLVLGEKNDSGVQQARAVTQEEISSGSKTIFDVVLPTPGFDVLYPENLVKRYEELMSKDNIDCHNMKHKIKEFSLFGSYRPLLAKPMFVEWETRQYVNGDDTVLYTDKEALEFGTKLAPEPSTENTVKTAIVLKLGLASSQYATMALREVMKQETSRHGWIYFAE